MIILVSITHSCSNFNGTGQKVISEILADKTGSYDFISPQLYTQNIGSMVEYCANYNILWTDTSSNDSFVYYLSQNSNYNVYGTYMILSSLFSNNLLNTWGSNKSNLENLYFYQSNSISVSPPIAGASGWKQIDYAVDNGATNFFNTLFNSTNNLGRGSSMEQWWFVVKYFFNIFKLIDFVSSLDVFLVIIIFLFLLNIIL